MTLTDFEKQIPFTEMFIKSDTIYNTTSYIHGE